MATRILAFSGSSRSGSFNVQLLSAAVGLARAKDAEVTVLDLRELALPLYDGDLEAANGLPDGAVRFKQAIREHDALLIASPEYNGFFTPLLKNAIDWATRPHTSDGQRGANPFPGKAAALLAASPGALGGIRALPAVRILLSGIGVLVAPTQMSLPLASKAFDDQGQLLDASHQVILESMVAELFKIAHPA